MPIPSNLPHLLRLLDDETPSVREAVARELESFGDSLERELARLDPPLTGHQLGALRSTLGLRRRERLCAQWPSWLSAESDSARLEAGLNALSVYLDERIGRAGELPAKLDELAAEYSRMKDKADPMSLARFLFVTKGISGADDTDYYKPSNSDLLYVIEKKRGLPISLTALYMLVGRRLGLDIAGCNLPGHFMARLLRDGEAVLVDCFDGGRVISSSELRRMADGGSWEYLEGLIAAGADAVTIIARFLNNLTNAYTRRSDADGCALMRELLASLSGAVSGRPGPR